MTDPLIVHAGGQLFRFHYEEMDRPLFIVLGAALAEAQALEFLLASLLGLADPSKAGRPMEELSEEFLSKTLGYLAKKIQEQDPSDETATILENLVKKRNYLVHKCLREYGWPMSTVEEYAKAVQEIDGIRTLLRDGGDAVTVALKRAKKLDLIIVRTNPETGLPELVE